MIFFESLKIAGFRNLLEQEVNFAQGTQMFLGQNGQGKSNLLEALYLLATGKSFRTSSLKDLIGFDKKGFCLEATLIRNQIRHRIYLEHLGTKKKLIIDQTTHTNFHPLMGFIPVVMITPEMKYLVDGSPQERRKFIDFLASQLSRPYFEAITRFHKAMKQRNVCLKQKEDCVVWEKMMAECYAMIAPYRQKLIEELCIHANLHLKKDDKLDANLALYLKKGEKAKDLEQSAKSYFEAYLQTRPLEMQLGTTLLGPHRDDLDIFLNQKLASITASEGQKKMIVVALSLAAFDLLKKKLGIDPLMLIDDFDAHFDTIRTEWIKQSLKDLPQSFLTTPKDPFFNVSKVFHVEKGSLSELSIQSKK